MTYTPPYHVKCYEDDGFIPVLQIKDAEDRLIRTLPLAVVRVILAVRGELEEFAGRHEE